MTVKSRGWEVDEERNKRDMCWNNPLKLKFTTDKGGVHLSLRDFLVDLIVFVKVSSGNMDPGKC